MERIFVLVPRFELGHCVSTPNALDQIPHEEIVLALNRHAQCDWGELGAHDKSANDRALADGGRLLSAYTSTANVRFWIITEADRSVTTVLLPEDY